VTKPLLVKVLEGDRADPPPLWLMRQAGRYLPEYRAVRARAGSFLDLCYNPELATEVTLQPIRRFGFDAAILFSDILVIPDALGQPVAFHEGEGPVLEPLESAADIAALDGESVISRLEPVLEAVARIRTELAPEVALIGFCGAPWTVATYMIGGRGSPDQAAARLFAYREPEAFAALVDLLVEVSARYLSAQVEAGAQVLQIFDSWAGTLPEDQFQRWCLEPVRRLIARVKEKHGDVPVIGFPRAAGPSSLAFAERSGADAIGCDTSLPLAWIRDTLQQRMPVQGNLDPLLLVAGGTALEARVRQIRESLAAGPHVFNLGHGIVPQTPVEHVARLVELVREEQR